VYPSEREHGQLFRADAVLELDTAPAASTDDLTRTVNYAELSQRLHGVLTGEPVDLIETLAQRLADVCLGYPRVQAVEITVHKPEVDLGVPADDVTVAIRRERTRPSPRLQTDHPPLSPRELGGVSDEGQGAAGAGSGPDVGERA
jgi:dihydroneopterin aldolase